VEVFAQGAEEGMSLDWELSDTRIDDFEFFQALCVRADNGAPGRADPDQARFETADTVCGAFAPGAAPPAPLAGGGLDGGLDAGSGGGGSAGDLYPAAVCGTATAPSTSLRVDDLENGVVYEISWIGIDPAGNPTAVPAGVVTPQPV